ncbi:MAG: restriction endonuclease subunit S, partial [Firmicutes bacterium]|nr:restriction endonuclease subunit S [Bacillota bacterium]
MTKIDEMIQEMCPKGVEYKALWEVTDWDKRFSGVEARKQPTVLSFVHISAAQLKNMQCDKGAVKLLATGKFDGYTSETLAGNCLNEGEVITIPSGGTANIKYYQGLFVDSGNILACAKEGVCLKYVYYCLDSQNDTVQGYYRGSGVAHPDMTKILDIQIPIPPLAIQQEIVSILDKFVQLQAELQARKKQYEYYRNKPLTFDEQNMNGGYDWSAFLARCGTAWESKGEQTQIGTDTPINAVQGVDTQSGVVESGGSLSLNTQGCGVQWLRLGEIGEYRSNGVDKKTSENEKPVLLLNF